LFPTASGNRLDIYVRSAAKPVSIRLTKEAVLVGRKNGGGLWQVSVLKTDMPGFYDVDKIIKSDVADSDSQTGLAVDSDSRSFNFGNESSTFLPDIVDYVEAAYTPFQTAVIRFVDTTTDPALAEGSVEDYDIFLRGMPLIREMHDFVSGRAVRPTAGDVVVKAPVPCDLRLSFDIYKKPTDAAIDTATIKKALADKVNSLGFTGRLAASVLQSVIHEFLTSTQTVSSIEMFGKIRRPDGTIKYIRDFDALEIPNEPSKMVSAKTTVFILEPDDVGVAVQVIDDQSV
jgi:hypothetical protein